MQISPNSPLFALAPTPVTSRNGVTTDSASTRAGFASLLLQTNQAMRAPLPAPAPPRPQPQSPSAAEVPRQAPVAARAPMPAPKMPPPAVPAHADPASRVNPAQTDAPGGGAAAHGESKSSESASAATPPADAGTSPSAGNSSTLAQTRRGDAARTAQRARLRTVDGTDAPVELDDALAADGMTGDDDALSADETTRSPRGDDATGRSDGSAAAAALNLGTAALPLPAAPTPPAGADGAAASAAGPARGKARDRGDAVEADGATTAAPPSATAAAVLAGKKEAASAAADATASAAAPSAGNAFAALLAEQRTSESSDSRRPTATDDRIGAAGVANAAGAAFGATGPTTGSTATVPTVVVDLPAMLTSADFGQHLGVQVSLLARDGVQHAELHLNPADMGPVSVQITMDGTQARVDFGAEVAATRQAIEAGLPALASALADAGFTLAGGGVSQHAGSGSQGQPTQSGRPGPSGQGSSGSSTSSDASAGAGRVLRRTVSAGGVDLYA